MAVSDEQPSLPIPISAIGGKYLLFDIQVITWLRKHHRICGVFIGALPQNPSQNVFMGLPMEIMPEEAQLLIDQGIGYILDDAKAHDVAMAKANRARRREYVANAQQRAEEIAYAKAREKEYERKQAMKKNSGKGKANKLRQESMVSESTILGDGAEGAGDSVSRPVQEGKSAASLFGILDQQSQPEQSTPIESLMSTTSTQPHPGAVRPPSIKITPTTSSLLLAPNNSSTPTSSTHHRSELLPGLTPASHALYTHLHNLPNHTYFMTPGLRFGCQFCVYPGDPLRFHSHFLAVGVDWEEEIDLMDIVGGGRLGTGVKKGYMLGGKEPARDDETAGKVRTFSIEWAGM